MSNDPLDDFMRLLDILEGGLSHVVVGKSDLIWAEGELHEEHHQANLVKTEHLHFIHRDLELCFGELVTDKDGDCWFNFIPSGSPEGTTSTMYVDKNVLDFMREFILTMVVNGAIKPKTPEGVNAYNLGSFNAPKKTPQSTH